MKKILSLAILLFATFLFLNCGGTTDPNVVSCEAYGDTPTAAYKRLYDAVKSKDTAAIKTEMTTTSIEFASGISAKNNTPLEKVFENGFTGTTFAPTLPEMRDERVNCNMGALEVWHAKDQKWEDLPFIIEDGKWKLAIGDLFKGSFKSPGKGLAIKEAEAANIARGNVAQVNANANTNRMPLVNKTNASNK